MSSQSSVWVKITAADGFGQISTTGKKVKTKDCSPFGEYPVIDQGQEKVAGYIDDPEKLISVTEPLIIFGDHTRAVKWVDFSFVPGADGTKILQTKPYLLPRFAYHQLRSLEIPNKGYSRHFKFLKELAFEVPPLAEQKVIADKLDILLAQVENTKARLERIPKILKRFRQSVLAAAVSGRLTEEWRPNSNSYVHASSSNWSWPPVPETWQVNLYSELVDSRLGKMLDKSKNRGIPTKYLGNINVRWFEFNLTKAQEILATEGERTELAIRPGDVLICEGGEPGRCAIWDDQVKGQIVFQKALHRARVREALIPEWLAFNLRHDADSLTLEQLFTGTTIKHLTGKALKKYPLRIPPIDEQTEIVRQVNQLFAYADRIEQHANNALARVNKQSQSILAKAFQGELTEQWRKDNPDLISGEHSAAALLERIKTKQAAQTPHKQVKKYMKVSKASVTTGSNVFSIDSHS